MRTRLLTALALGALAFPAVPSSAAAGSEYLGGCGFDTINGLAVDEDDVWTGAIYSTTVVFSQSAPEDNPVSATVTCTIEVNDVPVVTTPLSGTGVVAGWQLVEYTAGHDDVVGLCETVDYTSDDTPTTTRCDESIMLPPDTLPPIDCAGSCIDWLPTIDALVCPVFAQLDPYDVPDVLEVNSQGDIWLAGGPFWDCPPYDIWE